MALNIFSFQEKIMVDNFLIKLTQLEKTGSIGKYIIQLRNLKLKRKHFQKKSSNTYIRLLIEGHSSTLKRIPICEIFFS